MTTTSTDRAPSPQDFKRPASRLFVATVLVLTMGAGMWLGYQQRQLADLTEQLRVLKQRSPTAPVPVEPRLTALEQKVAELERKPPPPPPPPPPPFEARLATLETEVARLKSVDVSAFSKRLDASELKQKQQEKQLASLEQSQKEAALNQDKIARKQLEMRERISDIVNQLLRRN